MLSEPTLKTIRVLLSPHYLTNILLAVVFFVCKTTYPICSFLFEDCHLVLKEWDWLLFLACIIVLKNRKQATAEEYVSVTCMFAKVLNALLFFKTDPVYAFVYVVFCLLQFIFLPQPSYSGPEYITYFRGPNLAETIQREKKTTWIIEFYAAWSPPCVTFSGVFSEVSSSYHMDNLKFGKIDVSRYPKVAEKYDINTGALSKQLPTVVLFQDGKEKMRRPLLAPNGRVLKTAWTKENIISEFELNSVYADCKKNLKIKKEKPKQEKQD
ncbi:hypothetical protein ScPMuIL_005940 [Solemya velum]